MGRVQDKIVVVTGAAMGLGEASARLLACEGARVLMTDVSDAAGLQAAAAIREIGGTAHYMHHDVAHEDDWKRVMAQCKQQYGRLDVLVNNAGVGEGGPPHEETLEHLALANEHQSRWGFSRH